MLRAADLTIQTYYTESAKTDRFKESSEADRAKRLAFGFFGEIGGLLAALKKAVRDQLQPDEREAAREELGDALWYLINLARLTNTPARRVADGAHQALRAKLGEESRKTQPNLTFDALDSFANYHRNRLFQIADLLLRQLAEASGALVNKTYEELMQLTAAQRGELFGDLLATMTMLAVHFKAKVSFIARDNILKTTDRWPVGPRVYVVPERVGKDFEQLPAQFAVTFSQRGTAGKPIVVQQIHGLNIGDPLTDNSHVPDGYRFHDAFHLAYAAHLGWSPVIRALLKLKRKSVPKVDENDDGARAIIIEEGIATWIFNHAQQGKSKNYATVEVGRLQYDVLKQVRQMVTGFEVANAPLWQWEIAILEGFRIFRELLANKGGTVHVDLVEHTLRYEPLLAVKKAQQ